MEKRFVARPYAKAIFDMAIQNNELQKWQDFLYAIAELSGQKDVMSLYNNPNVSENELERFLMDSLKKESFEQSNNLVKLLVKNKRLKSIKTIVKVYDEMMREHESIGYVDLISCVELSKDTKEVLKKILIKKLSVKDVVFNCSIDQKVIGGLIIKMGNYVIDGSVSGKIIRLKEHLLN